MEKTIALVTGASSGIGSGLVQELLNRGMHVIAVSRFSEKSRRKFTRLSRKRDVNWIPADLSSIDEVKKLDNRIRKKYSRIDYLFNIAGCLKLNLEKSADDLEYMFAANYLGHFLLTNRLFPLLKKSGTARVCTVSGEGHRECLPEDMNPGNIDYDRLLSHENFESGYASRQVVLAKVLFTYELAKRVEKTGVETFTFCPGITRTNILNDFPWHVRKIAGFQRMFQGSRSPSELAVDICKLALHFEDVNGKYYVIRKSGIREEKSSPESYYEDLAKKLWNISEYLTEESFGRKYFEQ